jgi:hypothetical protein
MHEGKAQRNREVVAKLLEAPEHRQRLEEFFQERTVDRRNSGYVWEDTDPSLPAGWRSRQSNSKKFYMAPDGAQFATRRLAILPVNWRLKLDWKSRLGGRKQWFLSPDGQQFPNRRAGLRSRRSSSRRRLRRCGKCCGTRAGRPGSTCLTTGSSGSRGGPASTTAALSSPRTGSWEPDPALPAGYRRREAVHSVAQVDRPSGQPDPGHLLDSGFDFQVT